MMMLRLGESEFVTLLTYACVGVCRFLALSPIFPRGITSHPNQASMLISGISNKIRPHPRLQSECIHTCSLCVHLPTSPTPYCMTDIHTYIPNSAPLLLSSSGMYLVLRSCNFCSSVFLFVFFLSFSNFHAIFYLTFDGLFFSIYYYHAMSLFLRLICVLSSLLTYLTAIPFIQPWVT